jgi:acyl-CoA thioesterase I
MRKEAWTCLVHCLFYRLSGKRVGKMRGEIKDEISTHSWFLWQGSGINLGKRMRMTEFFIKQSPDSDMKHFKIIHRICLAGLLSLVSLVSTLASPVRLACVGDSITWGYGISNRQFNSYPAQLAVMLGTNWDVRNFGINGTTLLHQGDRPYVKQAAYTRALAFKPDVAVIDFGANDSKHPGDGSLDANKAVNNWQYKTNFVHDYEEMIAAFRQANPQARIFICLPTPDYPGRWGINDKTIRVEMIPMIHRVASESDVAVIDLYTALSDRKELFPDTVHPNAAGAGLMAAAVYRALTGPAAPAAAK